MSKSLSLIVTEAESGIALVAVLKKHLDPSYSNKAIKRAIESNRCTLNGRIERHASTRVGTGDKICFTIDAPQKSERGIKSLGIEKERILYEDHQLIAYNKPAGITSDQQGLDRLMQSYNSAARLIHRLDRDTTGVLLFAKSEKVFHDMRQLFQEHKINKTYLALVDGVPSKSSGVIENFLGKVHSYQGQALRGEVDRTQGRYARTEWVCEKKSREISLMRCTLVTGRTHQLRVHLSGIGHPILGDYQYCQQFRSDCQPQRCMLHAYEMRFTPPGRNQELIITAPLPDDFQQILDKWMR